MAMIDISSKSGPLTINGAEITRIVAEDPQLNGAYSYSVCRPGEGTMLVDEASRDKLIQGAGLIKVEYDAGDDFYNPGRRASGEAWMNPEKIHEIDDNADTYEAKAQFPKWVKLKGEAGFWNVTAQSAAALESAADA